MRMKYRLGKKLYNGHIKNKLLGMYFFLLLIPLGCFSIVTFSKLSYMMHDQTLSAATKTFSNTQFMMEENFRQIDEMMNTLAKNKLIYRMATTDLSGYPIYNQLIDSKTLVEIFKHFRDVTNVERISFYVNNESIYAGQNKEIFKLESIQNKDWFVKASESKKVNYWFDPELFQDTSEEEKECFSMVRLLYDPSDLSEILAVLRIEISKKYFMDLAIRTPVTENSSFFLIEQNRLLVTSNKHFDKGFYTTLFLRMSNETQEQWHETLIGKEKYFYRYASISDTQWYMVSVIPYEDVYGEITRLIVSLLLLVIVVGGMVYCIAYALSSLTLNRVIKLTQSIQKVEEGDMSITIQAEGTDEIGVTMQAFNNMMQRINILMQEKEEAGKAIKSLELKALQAQINPHFLYNSLDLINCIAIDREIPEIVTMVKALGQFYKISLSRGRDCISIKEELRHVELYVQILNLRFNQRVELMIQADEKLMQYKVIKIILQPIVENAIIHGIFEKASGEGMILVTVLEEGEDICLNVQDDGIGMSEMTFKKHFNFDKSMEQQRSGYGVRNVHERIKLAYGDKYGITCTSKIDSGTIVTLRIPKILD